MQNRKCIKIGVLNSLLNIVRFGIKNSAAGKNSANKTFSNTWKIVRNAIQHFSGDNGCYLPGISQPINIYCKTGYIRQLLLIYLDTLNFHRSSAWLSSKMFHWSLFFGAKRHSQYLLVDLCCEIVIIRIIWCEIINMVIKHCQSGRTFCCQIRTFCCEKGLIWC